MNGAVGALVEPGMVLPPLPYCGAPPTPATLLGRWNLDPVLITILAVGLAVYIWRAKRVGLPRWRKILFSTGWGLASFALISPLCPLSVALFSARVGQHLWLTTVCAPLVVLGRPWQAAVAGSWAPGEPPRGGRQSPSSIWAATAFALAMWTWHAPGPYAATFANTTVYWVMHLSLFGSAVWLWASLLELPTEPFASQVGALAITAIQMGLLGALLMFAPHPLYQFHLTTTAAWGVTPMWDQQLGAVLMWVPSGFLFVAGFAWAFVRMMQAAEARAISLAGRRQ